MLKVKDCQPIILELAKLFFKNAGESKDNPQHTRKYL